MLATARAKPDSLNTTLGRLNLHEQWLLQFRRGGPLRVFVSHQNSASSGPSTSDSGKTATEDLVCSHCAAGVAGIRTVPVAWTQHELGQIQRSGLATR